MATVLGGRRAAQLETGTDIRMLRFDPTSSDVLVAAGGEARVWDPAKKASSKVDGGSGNAVLGVDRFAGGLVLWTTSKGELSDRLP